MKLVFLSRASLDLEEIYQYGFDTFGELQADEYAASLDNCFQTILKDPEIGRLDTRVFPAVRRHEHKNHVICYDILNGEVVIVRLLHKSMNFLTKFSAN